MNKYVADAMERISELAEAVEKDSSMSWLEKCDALCILTRANYYLAYPDRAVYPKVRHATKKNPVRR